MVFTRIAPADASGVLLDFGQGCVERIVRPTLYARHSFKGMTVWLNPELGCGGFHDGSHGSPKQIGEVPRVTVFRWCHDHVQSLPLSAQLRSTRCCRGNSRRGSAFIPA